MSYLHNLMNIMETEFQQASSSSSVSKIEQGIPGPLPAKRGKLITEIDDVEEETCLICYHPFSNSGDHRLSCLACGHIFGNSCIKKWLKNTKKCPQCNDRAKMKDIRVLFMSRQALITADRDQALHDLGLEKIARQKAEVEITKLKLLNQSKEEEIQQLKEQVEAKKLCISKLEKLVQDTSTSNSTQMKGSTSSINVFSSGKRLFSNIIYGCFKD